MHFYNSSIGKSGRSLFGFDIHCSVSMRFLKSSSSSLSMAVGNQLFGALPPPSGLECRSMGQTHTLQPGLTTLLKFINPVIFKKENKK